MPNHRMLVIAALVVLTVPALGAAVPVVVGTPMREQLVEGHTVFTLIEVNRTTEVNGNATFSAAVAVLVREYAAAKHNVRFPGVLWFNDQYLVNPQNAEADAADYRYPCGGAVMAVNRGDPDPRMALANVVLRTNAPGGDVGEPANQYTLVNASADGEGAEPKANASADTTLGAAKGAATGTPPVGPAGIPAQSFGATHEETYRIVDPNDHVWIIDRYSAYYRASVSSDGFSSAPVYKFPVWVVNILGGHAFIPDDGDTSCNPYYDAVFRPVFDSVPNTDAPEVQPTPVPYPVPKPTPAPTNTPGTNDNQQPEQTKINDGKCDGDDYPPGGLDFDYPVRDDPCAGASSPSRNGYCYAGMTPPSGGCSQAPVRLYNALLYFELQHLTAAGAPRTHGTASTDTNGCHVGTEWSCPGGNEDAEGNSHPFHPTPHAQHAAQGHAANCMRTGGGHQVNPNPTNHGGSSGTVPGTDDKGNWGPRPCDYAHATRDVDIYFSPSGRPARPAGAYNANGPDTEGSTAPFHDYNAAYGASEP